MDKIYNAKGTKYYTNKWTIHHIAVLYDYMIENGYTANEFAEKLNMKPHTLRRWFRHDDVSLTSLNEALKPIGLQVACKFDVKVDENKSQHNESLRMGRPFIERDSKQLMFFQEAILEAGTSAEEVGNRLGLGACTMRRWFATQNIYLSKLFEISEVMNWELSISLVPLEESEMEGEKESEVEDKTEELTDKE